MYQNYIFFLFCELARYDNKELKQEPYDVQFPVFVDLFNEYSQSEYTEQDKSEYDCIEDFLTYKKVEKEKLINNIKTIIAEQLPQIDYNNDMLESIQRELTRYNKNLKNLTK